MEVKIVKMVLSLGSNLGDRIHYIQTAYNYISEEIGTIEKKSSFHANDPQGFESKNEFKITSPLTKCFDESVR